MVGIIVGNTVRVAVGVSVGVGVRTGALTHPRTEENKIIRINEINLIFFKSFTCLVISLFINNSIDLFSDSDLIREVYYHCLT